MTEKKTTKKPAAKKPAAKKPAAKKPAAKKEAKEETKIEALVKTFSNKSELAASKKALELIESATDYVIQNGNYKLLKGAKICGELTVQDVGKTGHKIKVLKVVNGVNPENNLFTAK